MKKASHTKEAKVAKFFFWAAWFFAAIGGGCLLVMLWMLIWMGPHDGFLSERFLRYQVWTVPGAFGGLFFALVLFYERSLDDARKGPRG